MVTPKVSFTIRRPTPVSRAPSSGADSDSPSSFKVPSLPRHLANPDGSTPGSPLARSATSSPKPSTAYHGDGQDSSDEDEEVKDELLTEFDRFGVQRRRNGAENQAPLVIPALQNRDWRELARKRRSAAQYVPISAKVETGKDGSVGGLGIRDTINSGPALSGLQLNQTIKYETSLSATEDVTMEDPQKQGVKKEKDEETEDQRALRAILSETNGIKHEGPLVDIIPTPISEADAYKQDVDELPDVATLDDYARVPVSQFGAALLRGMGWKEGTAATRKTGKGLVEPYLPAARPALLGIGAKEREVLDDGSGKKVAGRPEKRYVPVIKTERDGRASSAPAGRDRRARSRSPRQRYGVPPSSSRQSSPGRRRGGDRHDAQHERVYERSERSERYKDTPRNDKDREQRKDSSRGSSRRRRD